MSQFLLFCSTQKHSNDVKGAKLLFEVWFLDFEHFLNYLILEKSIRKNETQF